MDAMEAAMPYILALAPTIGIATLFYFIMKTIIEGDRRERMAQAKWEAEHQEEPAKPQRQG
jgi:hypothetical protein